jgi:gamma-glutamyltranspeptidase
MQGLEMAWSRFGRLSWASLVKPAADIARAGFPMHPYLHFILSGPFTYKRTLVRIAA